MAQHAHEALPCLALLLAQRAAHVGEDEQLVGESPLPEAGAANLPAAHAARERQVGDTGSLTGEGFHVQVETAVRPFSDLIVLRGTDAGGRAFVDVTGHVLNKTLGLLNYHFRNLDMTRRRFVKG